VQNKLEDNCAKFEKEFDDENTKTNLGNKINKITRVWSNVELYLSEKSILD